MWRLLAAALVLFAAPAAADPIADFYRGKTVTITVGYPPASGYTFYGQILARYLGDHIPGKPNVIVQNMPGAGSIKAANYLYNVAPKDGTAIGIFSIGALIDELFGESSTSFDTTRFAWVGNMDQSVGVCIVRDTTGIKTFDDLTRRETLFGGTGPSGGATQAALALTRLFGAKIKLVKGYPAPRTSCWRSIAARSRACAASPRRCSRAGCPTRSNRDGCARSSTTT